MGIEILLTIGQLFFTNPSINESVNYSSTNLLDQEQVTSSPKDSLMIKELLEMILKDTKDKTYSPNTEINGVSETYKEYKIGNYFVMTFEKFNSVVIAKQGSPNFFFFDLNKDGVPEYAIFNSPSMSEESISNFIEDGYNSSQGNNTSPNQPVKLLSGDKARVQYFNALQEIEKEIKK